MHPDAHLVPHVPLHPLQPPPPEDRPDPPEHPEQADLHVLEHSPVQAPWHVLSVAVISCAARSLTYWIRSPSKLPGMGSN